ncbi:MAG: 5'-methylthioadenosine/adenosylhomocysteine nucleosidase [Candidatus Latescibacterota bacterium]
MKRLFICMIPLLLLIAAAGGGTCRAGADAVTAILGAFDAEVEIIRNEMVSKRDTSYLGVTFTTGSLRGRRVVLAHTGYGKVNAAMTTTLVIAHVRPQAVIFTGIAGGLNPSLCPGDLVIGLYSAHHDYGYIKDGGTENVGTWNPSAGRRNPLFLPADSLLLSVARAAAGAITLDSIPTAAGRRLPRYTEGTIVSGDAFIASSAKKKELRTTLGADAVEMEGAAVAQICIQTATPCLIVRSISDRADSSAVKDVEQFYKIAARNSAVFVMKMIELLPLESRCGGR